MVIVSDEDLRKLDLISSLAERSDSSSRRRAVSAAQARSRNADRSPGASSKA
jgi:hypothetical protein